MGDCKFCKGKEEIIKTNYKVWDKWEIISPFRNFTDYNVIAGGMGKVSQSIPLPYTIKCHKCLEVEND